MTMTAVHWNISQAPMLQDMSLCNFRSTLNPPLVPHDVLIILFLHINSRSPKYEVVFEDGIWDPEERKKEERKEW